MVQARAHRPGATLAELDLVRITTTLTVEGQVVPSGTLGVIVIVHRGGQAFEVEIEKPVAAVVTLASGEVEPAW